MSNKETARNAANHMADQLDQLTSIVFDEDKATDWNRKRIARVGGRDRHWRVERNEFRLIIEDLDWSHVLNVAETKDARRAQDLFWLIAQGMRGWEAAFEDSATVVWRRGVREPHWRDQ